MISTNTAGGALSAGFLSAIEQTSREWRTRLVDENGDSLDCEIMSFTIHKGTRGQNYSIGTVYAPYFEISIAEYADTLMGREIGLEIAPVITQGTEPTEYARLCTGEVYEVVQAGDSYAVKCAGVLSLKGDLVLASDSTDVATVISALETLLGVSVVTQGSVEAMGLTGTLAQSMEGLTARTALQELATFFGGFVSEDANGDVILGSVYIGDAYEITSDMVQSEPEESGSLEVTGFTVVVQAGGEDAQGQIIPADSYADGVPVFSVICPYMTQAQFNIIKGCVTGETIYGGTVEQAIGNPLLEPWDHITVGNSVFAGAELVITDAVSVTVHSDITTAEEKPTVQVGPMQAQIAEIQEALYTIQDGQQYFWVDSDGAHVTKIPKETFKANPADGNTLTDTNGLDVRDGETSLAKFGALTRIGQDEQSHVEIDYHSMQLKDKNGNIYFYVSDLRGSDGYATITEHSTGDGSTKRFSVKLTPSSVESVTVNDISQTEGTDYSRNGILFTFTNAPASGAVITITYKTTSHLAKAFTIGKRNADNYVAPYSLAEGYLTTASGIYSHAEGAATIASGGHAHAEGLSSTASGDRSHAEGDNALSSGHFSHAEGVGTTASGSASHAQNLGTIAGYANQTAIGKYNDNKQTNAFEIGKGQGASNRSNAFAVDWSGNVSASGDLYVGDELKVSGATTFNANATRVASTGSPAVIAKRSDTNVGAAVMVGAGGTNHGLYSVSNDAWIICHNGTNALIPSQVIVAGHSSPIGTILTAHLTADKSVAKETGTALCSISLPAGTWLVLGRVRFPGNSTGTVRRANVSATSGSTDLNVQIPPNGYIQQTNFTAIVAPTSTTTYYLNAYHNATSALTFAAGTTDGAINGMRAVRIA